MPEPFFITGYPRSMTAWLSVALDCAHERDGESFESFMQKLESGEQIGNSESTTVLFYNAIKEKYPNSKWVVIEREKQDSLVSMCKVSGLNPEKLSFIFDALEQCFPNVSPALRVKFSEIPFRMEEIWKWCRPSEEFPAQRIKRLQILNVQQLPALIEAASKVA